MTRISSSLVFSSPNIKMKFWEKKGCYHAQTPYEKVFLTFYFPSANFCFLIIQYKCDIPHTSSMAGIMMKGINSHFDNFGSFSPIHFVWLKTLPNHCDFSLLYGPLSRAGKLELFFPFPMSRGAEEHLVLSRNVP